jgi:hypothetical protein
MRLVRINDRVMWTNSLALLGCYYERADTSTPTHLKKSKRGKALFAEQRPPEAQFLPLVGALFRVFEARALLLSSPNVFAEIILSETSEDLVIIDSRGMSDDLSRGTPPREARLTGKSAR